jgi:hypothetical protein
MVTFFSSSSTSSPASDNLHHEAFVDSQSTIFKLLISLMHSLRRLDEVTHLVIVMFGSGLLDSLWVRVFILEEYAYVCFA